MTVRIRVIPCLDVANGRVVKGVNFVDLQDAGDPVEQAQAYDAAGADELCFLDITASHENRDTILDVVRRTAECMVASIDARKVAEGRWEIFTHGGRTPTGIDALEHAVRMADLGAGELLVTSMDRDGTRDGYDLELTRTLADAVSIPVVASGGVGNLDHLVEGVTKGHANAVLAASIFHFGQYSIADAHAALRAARLPARA